MTDKNIYDLLNNTNIEIGDLEEVSQFEKEKFKYRFKKNNKKRKNNFRFIAVASLAITIGITSQTQLFDRVYASAESKLYNFNYSISKALNIKSDIRPYSNVVNQFVESNNIGIKLMDLVVDQDELIISSLLDINNLENKEDIESINYDSNIYINGKKLVDYNSSGSIGPIDEPYLISSIERIKVDDIDLYNDLNIKIVFNNMTYFDASKPNNKAKLKGRWEYEFYANGSELAKDSNNFNINHDFQIEGLNYKLETLRINPLSQKIYGSIRTNPIKNSANYDIELRGVDDKDNSIVFYTSLRNKNELILVYDNFEKDFPEDIKTLTLTPYAAKFPEKSGQMNSNYKPIGESFTINLD